MKKRYVTGIFVALALMILAVTGAQAQEHQHHHDEKKAPARGGGNNAHQHGSMETGGMTQEPHHMLAMAYAENMATFAKTLRNKADAAKTVDGDFARAAVTEIRRSFDTMQQHLGEHTRTVPAGNEGHAGMMHTMNAHVSAIRLSIAALEREIESAAPQSSKISMRAAEIIKHIDEMAGAHGEHKGH
jgi:hypothetical protein